MSRYLVRAYRHESGNPAIDPLLCEAKAGSVEALLEMVRAAIEGGAQQLFVIERGLRPDDEPAPHYD
jgi:hypothetical protein